jgi:hypothetical protein
MKFKLKELEFKGLLNYNEHKTNIGRIINLQESIEFQTPTLRIVEIDSNFITLSLLPSEACRVFYTKMIEFETILKEKFSDSYFESIFKNETFKVNIKNDNFKIYLNGEQFNIYHLKPGMDIICLVSISKLWISSYNLLNYTLKVNEMVLKKV